MPISSEDKVVFIHIPRTGGTSIEKQLGIYRRGHRALHSEGIYSEKEDHIKLYKETGLQHYTRLEIQKFLSINSYHHHIRVIKKEIDNYSWFTIVRNPWTRFVSHWWQWQIPNNIQKTHIDRQNISALCDNLKSYIRKIKKMSDIELMFFRDAHLRKQWEFISASYDQIYSDVCIDCDIRIARYEMFFDDISKILGSAPKKLDLLNEACRPKISDLLDDYCINEIGEIYSEDIDLFGYSSPVSTPAKLDKIWKTI